MALDDTAKIEYNSTNQTDVSVASLNASQGEPRMSENNITVRELAHEDMPEFLAVAKTFFEESYHRDDTIDLEQFGRLISRGIDLPHIAIPTVFVDGKLAGYAVIHYNTEFKVEREGDMAELYLHPDYRGTGASRALADAVDNQFKAWGVRHAHLWAAPGLDNQEKALGVFRNLWAKYGFKQTGIIMTKEY